MAAGEAASAVCTSGVTDGPSSGTAAQREGTSRKRGGGRPLGKTAGEAATEGAAVGRGGSQEAKGADGAESLGGQ